MAIKYNKLFQLLKQNGWNTTRIRNEKLLGQRTLTAIKNNTGGLDHRSIDKLCRVLECQPGDIMEYVPDKQPDKPTE